MACWVACVGGSVGGFGARLAAYQNKNGVMYGGAISFVHMIVMRKTTCIKVRVAGPDGLEVTAVAFLVDSSHSSVCTHILYH